MKNWFVLNMVLILLTGLFGQNKKILQHSDYEIWNHITHRTISQDGQWVAYSLGQENRDGECHIVSANTRTDYQIARGDSVWFFPNIPFACIRIHPPRDSIRKAKLETKKKEKLPKDTLAIFSLTTGQLIKLNPVIKRKIPKKAGEFVAFFSPMPENKPDSTQNKNKQKIKGDRLIVYFPLQKDSLVYNYVTSFSVSENGNSIVFVQNKADSLKNGVHLLHTVSKKETILASGAGEFTRPVLDKKGRQVAFIHNFKDTTSLFIKEANSLVARRILGFGDRSLPKKYQPGVSGKLKFSDSGKRLFFGISKMNPKTPKDTIPDDEKVIVDVWNWRDPLLQPQQLKQLKKEKERTLLCVWQIRKHKFVQLATEDMPKVRLTRDGDSKYVLGLSDLPYRKEISWDFPFYNDVYSVQVSNGKHFKVLTRLQGNPSLSPTGDYMVWWDREIYHWKASSLKNGRTRILSQTIPFSLRYDLHDWPYRADSYGAAGWTQEGKQFLVYDKFDIWALDVSGKSKPENLTREFGRKNGLRLRRIKIDPDEKGISLTSPQLLNGFNYTDKSAGYFLLKEDSVKELVYGKWRFTTHPLKAQNADALLYTRENYEEFPDLRLATTELKNDRQISHANPQQKEYQWGHVQLFHWFSADGLPLDGLLYTPENFDPKKQYPLMVYFYERNSQNLHRYWAPQPHRSIINFTFYTSRGYVVFVPDIPYEVGYPGPSAMKAVMPGVTALMAKGFIDEKHIGVQGHSWGGYQIAYMVTQTHLFAAAEAGAPVSNMVSAYGGIRWGSGMSRMFQYEKTQSRIGGSLWERPLQYLENSPIFWADKITTPLLIMHNDHDGAVPWYQGIELFVALRRLGKPAWMINYNNQPHWPVTYANKRDWAIRMQQFFDHFLKNAPAPAWLSKGIPAVQKGKTLGYETENN